MGTLHLLLHPKVSLVTHHRTFLLGGPWDPPNCLGGPWAPQLLGGPLGPLGPGAQGPRVLEARVLEVQSAPWAHRPKGPMPLGPPWAQNLDFL